MSADQAVVLDRLYAKDQLVFGLSDTLDTKASIALVVITFLATQTGWFIAETRVTGILLGLQVCSAWILAVAGALALLTLWPRVYQTEAAEEFDEWVEQLTVHFQSDPDAAEKVAFEVAYGEIGLLKNRIARNGALNEAKGWYLEGSFWTSSAAFAINLLTVIALAIQRLF